MSGINPLVWRGVAATGALLSLIGALVAWATVPRYDQSASGMDFTEGEVVLARQPEAGNSRDSAAIYSWLVMGQGQRLSRIPWVVKVSRLPYSSEQYGRESHRDRTEGQEVQNG